MKPERVGYASNASSLFWSWADAREHLRPDLMQGIEQEIRIALAPYVAQMHDALRQEGLPYATLKQVEGRIGYLSLR